MKLERLRNDARTNLSLRLQTTRAWGTPATIFLEVTNRCNIECIMCLQTQDPRYQDPSFVGDMNAQTIEKLSDVIAGSSIVCTFGVGEPLLNKHIFEIFKIVKKHQGRITLTSNGTVLNSTIIEKLLDHGVDWITFSIDGTTAQVFESIREKANFSQVWNNVRNFCRRKKERGMTLPEVYLEMVAMGRNFHQLPELVNMAAEIEAKSIVVQPLYINEWKVAGERLAKDRLDTIPLNFAAEIWELTVKSARSQGISIVSPFLSTPLENYFRCDDDEREHRLRPHNEIDQNRVAVNLSSPITVPDQIGELKGLQGWLDLPRTLKVRGKVRFKGWAIELDSPNHSVEILIRRSDRLLRRIVCDQIRVDVWNALRLKGKPTACGFEFTVRLRARPSPIEILAVSGTKQHTLGKVFSYRGRFTFLFEIYRWIAAWRKRTPSAMYCSQPWSVIHVSKNGDVRTCCQNETVFGNLTDENFSAIWNGPAYRQFRHNVRQGIMDNQCKRCLLGGYHKISAAPYLTYGGVLKAFLPRWRRRAS